MIIPYALVVSFSLFYPLQESQSKNSEKTEPAKDLKARIAGRKAIVEFDLFTHAGSAEKVKLNREDVEKGLRSHDLTSFEALNKGLYLVDLKEKKLEDALKELPMRMGAISFQDGKFEQALGYESNRRRTTVVMKPDYFACIRWGSTANDQEKMKADREKYSKLPGIKAEFINTAPGKRVFGNPNMLKLTPEKDVTLLEVFLRTGAGFNYLAADDAQKGTTKKPEAKRANPGK